MSWNYRIMRHIERAADNDETFYCMHEVYYTEDGAVERWTSEPCGSPCGATLEEMVGDLAWITAGLTKPVLDFATGKEIGPVAILADDLTASLKEPDFRKALEDRTSRRTEAKPEPKP